MSRPPQICSLAKAGLSVNWQSAYERYLQGPIWSEKRRLVFQRSRRLCEGCGVRPVKEVHHLRYPAGLTPGSPEWIRVEKLFDLVALCADCHADLHPQPSAALRAAARPLESLVILRP